MSKISELPILFQDDHFVAIHKPAGIHVHPTRLAPREDTCMRILRDQLGRRIYTVHRLDRATSGVLLCALSATAAKSLSSLFARQAVWKHYLAVVRGYPASTGKIDYALRESRGDPPREALTTYRRRAVVELPYAVGEFPTARYSLVDAFPQTGRKNQIRRHFAHISHPIVGDVNLGDGRHNRLFREKFGIHRLLLLAVDVGFRHPFSNTDIRITAPLPADVQALFIELEWDAQTGDVET